VTIQQLTEEFVRHYDNVLKLTANNPDGLRSALDEHPGLGASLGRLGKIFVWRNQYRWFSGKRHIAPAHPRFGQALKDFEERWRDAYNECRDGIYTRALNRIAQEFLWRFHLMVERTGDAPMAFEQLEKTDTELMNAFHELEEIQRALDSHPEFGQFIDRGPDEFRVALADWNERWRGWEVAKVII
jgi:hypothetical protein